jgi:hypothetical protein
MYSNGNTAALDQQKGFLVKGSDRASGSSDQQLACMHAVHMVSCASM